MATRDAVQTSATGRELAEALWLAAEIARAEYGSAAPGTSTGSAADGSAAGFEVARRQQGAGGGATAGASQESDCPSDADEPAAARRAAEERERGLMVRLGEADPWPDGSAGAALLPVRLSAPREIRDPLACLRALRALKQTTPSRHRRVIDEAATARRSADAGTVLPVFRMAPERSFDLDLVLDPSPSMILWRQLVFELRGVFQRLAAFRSIRILPYGHLAGHPSAEPASTSARSILLVLSDCVGPAWRDGSAQQLLGAWAAHRHVAVLNPLPQRLWNRTAIRTSELLLHTEDRASSNRAIRVLRAGEPWSTEATGAIPVPLLGLRVDDLAGWSALLAGRAGSGRWLNVLGDVEREGIDTEDCDGSESFAPPEAAPIDAPDAVELVANFLEAGSPAAFKLAGMLSTAPLTIPAMRAVQAVAGDEIGSTYLAEIFLSGLIEQSETGHERFEFAPGVRSALLATIRRSDAARLVDRLDGWMTQRSVLARHGGSFTGYVESADARMAVRETAAYVPYAGIPTEVLRRIGGAYAPLCVPTTVRHWTSQMLVLGEVGVGKSTIIRELINELDYPRQRITHPMRTLEHLLEHPYLDDVRMLLTIRDFGAPDIDYATCQFLFTESSLYVLAWDNAEDPGREELRRWLEMIGMRVPEPRVVLVPTGGLRSVQAFPEHPEIVGVVPVEPETGYGFQNLRAMLSSTAAGLPLMGSEWTVAWYSAADDVERREENYITAARLWQIMADAGLRDPGEQRALARALHELGKILFFVDDPELGHTAVLKPEWFLARANDIVDDPVAAQVGVLNRSRLSVQTRDLDGQIRPYLLELMERFELIFRLDRDSYLIAARLQGPEPLGLAELWEDTPAAAEREIRVVYALGTRPPGLLAHFIARTYRFTTRTHWGGGALLAHPDSKHRALVRTDWNSGEINLTVRGPAPATFFAVLDEGFSASVEHYPGLSVETLVPCRCSPDCTFRYVYRDLQNRLGAQPPRLDIQCPVSSEMVHLPLLLMGLGESTSFLQMFAELDLVDEHFTENVANTQRAYLRLLHEICSTHRMTRRPAVVLLAPGLGLERVRQSDELHVCCEEPGAWHLVSHGIDYSFGRPLAWYQSMAPHFRVLANLLWQSSWTDGSIPGAADDSKEQLRLEADVMTSLLAEFSSGDAEFATYSPTLEYVRALAELLDELDPERIWGGLTRVETPEGLPLYVCPEHAGAYRRR